MAVSKQQTDDVFTTAADVARECRSQCIIDWDAHGQILQTRFKHRFCITRIPIPLRGSESGHQVREEHKHQRRQHDLQFSIATTAEAD